MGVLAPSIFFLKKKWLFGLFPPHSTPGYAMLHAMRFCHTLCHPSQSPPPPCASSFPPKGTLSLSLSLSLSETLSLSPSLPPVLYLSHHPPPDPSPATLEARYGFRIQFPINYLRVSLMKSPLSLLANARRKSATLLSDVVVPAVGRVCVCFITGCGHYNVVG